MLRNAIKLRLSQCHCCHHQTQRTLIPFITYRRTTYSPLHRPTLLLLLGLVLASDMALGESDDTSDSRTVLIDPYRMSLALGAEGYVNCTMDDTTLTPGDNITSVTWYTEENEELGTTNLTGRGYSLGEDEESIVFKNVQVSDSQTFLCVVTMDIVPGKNLIETTGSYNGTFVYKVYEMPTYLREGLIILGINVALLIVFVACLARSMAADRRRLRKYAKTT